MRAAIKLAQSLVVCLLLIYATGAVAQKKSGSNEKSGAKSAQEKKRLKPQETCPIMGGKIDQKVFVDAAGYRFYACCPSCLGKIKADPKKALSQLRVKGERPEVRLAVCPMCGQVKGTKACCAKDAKKCDKCQLIKGSVGCCLNLKPEKKGEDVLLCPKCGQVKGTDKCCDKNAAICPKCNLAKGSPACCKLDGVLARTGKRGGKKGTKKSDGAVKEKTSGASGASSQAPAGCGIGACCPSGG